MKKLITFFIIIFVVIAAMFYMYSSYKENIRQSKRENLKFEMYKEKELTGVDIASIINKAVDSNEKNRS